MKNLSIGARAAVITLPGHRALDREACLEVLGEARRLGSRLQVNLLMLEPYSTHEQLVQALGQHPIDAIFVCAPEVRPKDSPEVLDCSVGNALRKYWSGEVYLCAIGDAWRLLAEQGLLSGRRVVSKATHLQARQQQYPDINWVTKKTCLQDGHLLSCSGMFTSARAVIRTLELLGERELTQQIAESLLLSSDLVRPNNVDTSQDIPLTHPVLQRVADLLSTNPSHPWTSASLARATYVSERHLQRLFKEIVGCGVLEHLQRLRLSRAIDVLRSQPVLSLQQVADACGFSSTQHLRRACQRAHGVSPSDLRDLASGAQIPMKGSPAMPAC